MAQGTALHSRRYIGNKTKLLDWIFETIKSETTDVKTFCDIFAGTGAVANKALEFYEEVTVNDILFSNNIIYKAFFSPGKFDLEKLNRLIVELNSVSLSKIRPNYFSKNYGNKFFEDSEAKKIGYIREYIERHKTDFTEKEYCILLTSLIYSVDKIANTLGHFEAYIRRPITHKPLELKLVDAKCYPNISIFREDANKLASQIHSDLVYLDPPYNSRQYSRFYHVYENLVKWNKPALSGTAMKPPIENMSEYCSSRAKEAMEDLVNKLKVRYIAVSYNNTYNSKSSSSENKIKLKDLLSILNSVGNTKTFEHSHKFFNAGKTEFKDHKEFLFITEVK